MGHNEPPHIQTVDAVRYRLQSRRGLAPIWWVAAFVVTLCALGNAFYVPMASGLFALSAGMFAAAGLLAAVTPEVEIGLHRVRVGRAWFGWRGVQVDVPWEALAGARCVGGRLVLVLRSGALRRTPVSADPDQVGWVADQITSRADHNRLTDAQAGQLVRDGRKLADLLASTSRTRTPAPTRSR